MTQNEVKLDLKSLFFGAPNLTFLVGAGCSVDEPSCLSSGREMIEAIINYTCAESEIAKLLELEELRFEALVEIIRDSLDGELRLIDYFGECDTPNTQHFFLAEMIKRGNFVITTNFDFLIERALLQSGVAKSAIVPVITKEDFESYSDPHELFNQGKRTVYKVHGATKNVITDQSTRDSLVATIQAFGSNKVGENVFQLEFFKRPAFMNLTTDRSLVVMGYSGSDDFDIVPTLKVLKRLNSVFWLNYIRDDMDPECSLEIFSDNDPSFDKFRKVNQVLIEIKRIGHAAHVYRVDLNTSRFIETLMKSTISISPTNFATSPRDWLKMTISAPSNLIKFSIPYKIYWDLDKIEDSLHCAKEMLRIAKKNKDQKNISITLNQIGMIYKVWGNYEEALKRYEEALRIAEQLGDLSLKATRLNNIASIYRARGNYEEALQRYEEALQIAEQLGDLSGKATRLNNIGRVYHDQKTYEEALQRYEEGFQIAEQMGDLSKKATFLNNIGAIYEARGNYEEALQRYEEALQIAEQLGDLSRKATFLNNIAAIYTRRGNYEESLKRFEEALRIAEQLGDLYGKATRLNNIATIYIRRGNYEEALNRLVEALHILQSLGLGESPNARKTKKSIEYTKNLLRKNLE